MLTRKGKTEIRNSSSAAVHELADHIGDVERHHTSHKGIPWHQRHIFAGIVRDDVFDAEKAEGICNTIILSARLKSIAVSRC